MVLIYICVNVKPKGPIYPWIPPQTPPTQDRIYRASLFEHALWRNKIPISRKASLLIPLARNPDHVNYLFILAPPVFIPSGNKSRPGSYSENRKGVVWANPSEGFTGQRRFQIKHIRLRDLEGLPSGEKLVSHSSKGWPGEAMERNLPRPFTKSRKKTGGGQAY